MAVCVTMVIWVIYVEVVVVVVVVAVAVDIVWVAGTTYAAAHVLVVNVLAIALWGDVSIVWSRRWWRRRWWHFVRRRARGCWRGC